MTDKVERGHQARQLLDNAIFNDTLSTLEASYVDVWKKADTVEAREDCHRYIVLLESLKHDLRSIATTGQLEQERRDALQGKPTTMYAPLRKANG